jgi:hypothetical protein
LIAARLALLAGLFILPVVLLTLGHRMRDRSARTKRLFWGGVIGHAIGIVVTMVVMMSPPVWWADTESVRTFAVHWAMVLGCAAGVAGAAVKG